MINDVLCNRMSLKGHRGVQKSKLYIPVIHTLASHLWHQQGNWGQSGVDVSKPAGYAVCDGSICLVTLPVTPAGSCILLVSSFFLYPAGAAAGSCFLLVSFFFFLLLSSSFFFWQHAFFTHFPTCYFDQTWSQ